MSSRFERAIVKLYNAFHEGTLNPECACNCAVGNILDNKDSWKHLSDDHGSLRLNYVGKVNEAFNKRFKGYLPSELLRIEHAFLKGCGYQLPFRHDHFKPFDPLDKDIQFDGMCAAIELLCKLDAVPNITDYTDLFREDQKQHILELV